MDEWGAVTLFHGLPSDRVRASAQDADGVMWFGTDGGLARFDGRRTQTLAAPGPPQGRTLALAMDADGALWVGTDAGASHYVNGEFRAIAETAGKSITSIITPERGRAVLASANGVVFDCRVAADGTTLAPQTIPSEPLASADRDHPGALEIASLAYVNGTLYAGTRSRGLMTIEGNSFTEIQSRPRQFFIEALERDARAHHRRNGHRERSTHRHTRRFVGRDGWARRVDRARWTRASPFHLPGHSRGLAFGSHLYDLR